MMVYEKYYVIKFSDDKTAKDVRAMLVDKLGKGISMLGSYDSAKDITQNLEDDESA